MRSSSLLSTVSFAAALTLALFCSGAARAATLAELTGVQPVIITADGATRRPVAPGIYEAAYSPAAKALYIASAEAVTGVNGGMIYKIDPDTLQTLGITHTDEKNFGLATDPAGKTLYITNSLGHGVSAMDTGTGRITARTTFPGIGKDGFPYGPRQVIYDAQQDGIYVGAVGNPGKIWLLDAKTLDTRATIDNAGKWVTGLALDPQAHRLYAANGDGEIVVVDTRKNEIADRWTPGDGKEWLLLNVALDAARHRLFVTDNSKSKTVAIFDTRTGKLTGRIDIGDSLDIAFDRQRDTLYVTHRQQGTLSAIDAGSLHVTKTYALPELPNSILLRPDGKAAYVTIKTPHQKDYSAAGDGSIARITLP
ncbi:YncE family protein [Castellaniella ginsengisoli]|uniref:YncE family protein n=1 Tax=Castellaniella ginsengisoli TaxID=546114 RepID=A0AB39GHP9_9BURK